MWVYIIKFIIKNSVETLLWVLLGKVNERLDLKKKIKKSIKTILSKQNWKEWKNNTVESVNNFIHEVKESISQLIEKDPSILDEERESLYTKLQDFSTELKAKILNSIPEASSRKLFWKNKKLWLERMRQSITTKNNKRWVWNRT